MLPCQSFLKFAENLNTPLPNVIMFGGRMTDDSFGHSLKIELFNVKSCLQVLKFTVSSEDFANANDDILDILLFSSNRSVLIDDKQSANELFVESSPPRIVSTLRRITTSPDSFFGALTRTLNSLDSYSIPVLGSNFEIIAFKLIF